MLPKRKSQDAPSTLPSTRKRQRDGAGADDLEEPGAHWGSAESYDTMVARHREEKDNWAKRRRMDHDKLETDVQRIDELSGVHTRRISELQELVGQSSTKDETNDLIRTEREAREKAFRDDVPQVATKAVSERFEDFQKDKLKPTIAQELKPIRKHLKELDTDLSGNETEIKALSGRLAGETKERAETMTRLEAKVTAQLETKVGALEATLKEAVIPQAIANLEGRVDGMNELVKQQLAEASEQRETAIKELDSGVSKLQTTLCEKTADFDNIAGQLQTYRADIDKAKEDSEKKLNAQLEAKMETCYMTFVPFVDLQCTMVQKTSREEIDRQIKAIEETIATKEAARESEMKALKATISSLHGCFALQLKKYEAICQELDIEREARKVAEETSTSLAESTNSLRSMLETEWDESKDRDLQRSERHDKLESQVKNMQETVETLKGDLTAERDIRTSAVVQVAVVSQELQERLNAVEPTLKDTSGWIDGMDRTLRSITDKLDHDAAAARPRIETDVMGKVSAFETKIRGEFEAHSHAMKEGFNKIRVEYEKQIKATTEDVIQLVRDAQAETEYNCKDRLKEFAEGSVMSTINSNLAAVQYKLCEVNGNYGSVKGRLDKLDDTVHGLSNLNADLKNQFHDMATNYKAYGTAQRQAANEYTDQAKRQLEQKSNSMTLLSAKHSLICCYQHINEAMLLPCHSRQTLFPARLFGAAWIRGPQCLL